MAWIRGAGSLYALRFLLGVAEAGLLPGVLLYLSRWVPRQRLALAFSILMATTALANVLAGPIATGLLQLDGLAGLRCWQLLFIAEGVPDSSDRPRGRVLSAGNARRRALADQR